MPTITTEHCTYCGGVEHAMTREEVAPETCEYCGDAGCHWTNHAEARSEVHQAVRSALTTMWGEPEHREGY